MKPRLPLTLFASVMAGMISGVFATDTGATWTQNTLSSQAPAFWKNQNVTIQIDSNLSFSGLTAKSGGNQGVSTMIETEIGNLTFQSDSNNRKNLSFDGIILGTNSINQVIRSTGKVSFDNLGDIIFRNISRTGKTVEAVFGLGGIAFDNTGNVIVEGLTGYSPQFITGGNGLSFTRTGTVSIRNNTNSSKYGQGGAISVSEAGITFDHIVATGYSQNNAIVFTNNTCDSYGGAIFTDNVTFDNITGSIVLEGNKTNGIGYTSAGGAIFAGARYDENNNYAREGVVRFENVDGSVIIRNNHCNFGDITDSGFGGAIVANGGAIFKNTGNIQIEGNTSIGAAGAIQAWGGPTGILFENTGSLSISDNHAGQHGGAFVADKLKFNNIRGDISIAGNTSVTNGGAIASFGGSSTNTTLDITNVTGNVLFKGNVSSTGQGGTIATEKTVTVSDIGGSFQAIGNKAATHGGTVMVSKNGSLTMNDIQGGILFSGNEAGTMNNAGSGGAIYSNGAVAINDNTGQIIFENNKALNNGGAIRGFTTVSVTDNASVIFQGNQAELGAGIYASHVAMTGNAGGILFDTNTQGGGIVTNEGNIMLSGNGTTFFTKNRIDNSDDTYMNAGGALTMTGGSHLLSADTGDITFSGNRVTTSSGEIMCAIGLNEASPEMVDANGNLLPAVLRLRAYEERTIRFDEGISAPGTNTSVFINDEDGNTGTIILSGQNAELLEQLDGESSEDFQARRQASRAFNIGNATVGNGTLIVSDKALLDAGSLSLSGNALLDIRENSTVHAVTWKVSDSARFLLRAGASLEADNGTLSLTNGIGIDVGSIIAETNGSATRFDAKDIVLGGTLTLKDASGQLYTANDSMSQDRRVTLAHDVQGTRNGTDFSDLVAEVPEYGYQGTWSVNWEGDSLIGQWTADEIFHPWDEFRGGAVYNSLWSTASNVQSLSGTVRDQSGRLRLSSEQKAGIWFSGIGDFDMQRSAGQADGYDYQGGGYALGGDCKVSGNHILGVAFGQISGRNTSRSYFAHNRQNSLMGAVYGAGLVNLQKHGNLRYSLTAAYGNTSNSIRMYDSVLNRNTTGKWDNTAWEIDSRIAWDITLDKTWTVSPFIGLEYTSASSDSFTESEKNPRHFSKGDLENLSIPVGCSISRNDSIGKGMMWDNTLSISYAPDVYRHNPRGTVSMPDTIQGWSTRGVNVGRHAGILDYVTGLQITGSWRTYAGYTLETRKNAILQTVRAGVGYGF